MCGLVAVITRRTYGLINKDVDIFDELLLVGQIRGDDATGIISVMDDTSFYIDKEATPSTYFAYSLASTDARKRVTRDGFALLGHNRKATTGRRDDEGAHPFAVKDRFALIHNGTLFNHEKLAKTDVDSEALAIVIEDALNGEHDNKGNGKLSETLSDIYGAYACIWYNQVTNKVQWIRNAQRPLFYAEHLDAYYIASEEGMLRWILNRNNVYQFTIKQVEVDKLYSFDLDKPTAVVTEEALTLKKSQPQQTVPTPTNVVGSNAGVTNTSVVVNGSTITGMSKKTFRSWAKDVLGKYVDFWLVDYVEKEVSPTSPSKRYLLLGETHIFGWKHTIYTFLDPLKLGIQDLELEADTLLFRGDVDNIEVNVGNKELEIWLDETTIKRITRPDPKLKEAFHASKNTTVFH